MSDRTNNPIKRWRQGRLEIPEFTVLRDCRDIEESRRTLEKIGSSAEAQVVSQDNEMSTHCGTILWTLAVREYVPSNFRHPLQEPGNIRSQSARR